MRASLLQLWQRLQASYYFIPGLMVLAAILLAGVTTWLDFSFRGEVTEVVGWFVAGRVEGARATLGAIAGSMISVAAVTFSLTMVAVTTASGQYGPRLIGNFMRDRVNQVTLGTFLATFIYALLILRTVSSPGDGDAMSGLVPTIGVLTALLFTLMSVAVLINFIHHVPETLNVGTITAKVAGKLSDRIRTGLYPSSPKLERVAGDSLGDPFDPALCQYVEARKAGFVQAVSLDGLVEWAQANAMRVRLDCGPGDFLHTGERMMSLVQEDLSRFGDEDMDTRNARDAAVRAFIAQGAERTEYQNVLFLADELVEICARALSPGVNDPFTAINCIHWFGEACVAMMDSEDPPTCLAPPDGTPRLWTRTVSLERLCGVLWGQSRPYVANDFNAARVALNTLHYLREQASSGDRTVIDRQIESMRLAVVQGGLTKMEKKRLRAATPIRP